MVGYQIKDGPDHLISRRCAGKNIGSRILVPELLLLCLLYMFIALFQGFSKNGQNTIEKKDPTKQSLIGNRLGLSFHDIHLANLMYSCNGKHFSYPHLIIIEIIVTSNNINIFIKLYYRGLFQVIACLSCKWLQIKGLQMLVSWR